MKASDDLHLSPKPHSPCLVCRPRRSLRRCWRSSLRSFGVARSSCSTCMRFSTATHPRASPGISSWLWRGARPWHHPAVQTPGPAPAPAASCLTWSSMSVSTPSHPRTLKQWLRPSRATPPFRTPLIPTATAAASACNPSRSCAPLLVHHYSPHNHTLLARLRLSCRYTLCQLAQWQSHVTLELHRPSLELSASQRRRCYAALLLDGETCSALQAEGGGLLPVAHEPEYRELTTQFTLDWALPQECKAVEVDGPRHFL